MLDCVIHDERFINGVTKCRMRLNIRDVVIDVTIDGFCVATNVATLIIDEAIVDCELDVGAGSADDHLRIAHDVKPRNDGVITLAMAGSERDGLGIKGRIEGVSAFDAIVNHEHLDVGACNLERHGGHGTIVAHLAIVLKLASARKVGLGIEQRLIINGFRDEEIERVDDITLGVRDDASDIIDQRIAKAPAGFGINDELVRHNQSLSNRAPPHWRCDWKPLCHKSQKKASGNANSHNLHSCIVDCRAARQ